MHTMIAVVAALAAGMAFATEGVLQQGAASSGPASETVPAMMRRLLGNTRWWLGAVAAVSSYGFQAVALSFAPLALVQPLVVSEVLFAIPFAAHREHVPLRLREWVAIAAVMCGMSAAIVAARPQEGDPLTGASGWGYALGAVALILAVCLVLAHRLSGTIRASLYALAASLVLGIQSALYKTSIALLGRDGFRVFTHWQAYALIAASFLGLYLVQRAYKSGPLAASMPVMDAVMPAASIALGLGLFGERVRTSGWALAVAFAGLVVLIAGIVALDSSEAVHRQQQIEDQQQQRRAEQEA